MLTSVNGGTPATEWYASALAPTGTTSANEANTFEQQLFSVIADSLERLSVDPESVGISTSRNTSPNETAESAKCQNLVSYAPTADAQSSASNASSSKTTVQSSAPSSTSPTDAAEDTTASTEPAAMTALRAALLAAGHDPDKFGLTYQEHEVSYPGGSYLDRTITANFSDGYTESYGADLTEASPNGTVLSIEHTLRDIAAGDYS